MYRLLVNSMFIFYHKSQRGHRNNNHIYAHNSWSHRASLQGIKELPGILIDCPGTKNLDRLAGYQGVAGDLHMSAGYQELISKVYRSLSSLTGYKGVAGHLDKLVRYKDVTDLSLSFPALFDVVVLFEADMAVVMVDKSTEVVVTGGSVYIRERSSITSAHFHTYNPKTSLADYFPFTLDNIRQLSN